LNQKREEAMTDISNCKRSSADSLQHGVEITQAELLNYDKFMLKLKMLDDSLKQIVAQVIDDPIVLKTEWISYLGGGTSFRSHKLVQVTASKLEFCSTTNNKLLCLLFILIGAGEGIFVFATNVTKGTLLSAKIIGALIICALFAIAGSFLLFKNTTPIIFDKQEGIFKKGKNSKRLQDVHALQVIPVLNPRSGNFLAYYSYELLLVFKDGKRISIVNHSDRHKLLEDANVLGKFIQKPVWDAIDISLKFYQSVSMHPK
jgi:hypothetical protein